MPIEISRRTARRFILGRQGIWPGRRRRGLDGADQAIREMGELQLDPLVLVARAQDLILHARVLDYPADGWATLTYERRRFFDWGGWLAIRPFEELPHWRVLMRRERSKPYWQQVVADHGPAIDEMRVLLRERGEVGNRDFSASSRTRIDSYRGRKDSALALHYLWRVGEAMVTRRERFERIYAPTEAIVPRELLRESGDAEADDFLLTRMVENQGLAKFANVSLSLMRPVSATELASWREAKLASGALVEVRVEGWRAAQLAPGGSEPVLRELEAGRIPADWTPLATTTDEEVTFLAPLDPVSARGRAKPLFEFDYAWEIYTPAAKRTYGPWTMPILWGDRLVGRFDSLLDRRAGTLVVNGLWLEDAAFEADDAFAAALAAGMGRLLRFLEVGRIDVGAVAQRALRNRLASAAKR
jgi:uncharacterized protein